MAHKNVWWATIFFCNHKMEYNLLIKMRKGPPWWWLWSACSHSTPKIRVWIPLRSTIVNKMGHPRPLLRLFSLFFRKTLIQFLEQMNVKNVYPVYGAGIRTHECESCTIASRPGLPLKVNNCLKRTKINKKHPFLKMNATVCRGVTT